MASISSGVAQQKRVLLLPPTLSAAARLLATAEL
jgi:hypothetical protein